MVFPWLSSSVLAGPDAVADAQIQRLLLPGGRDWQDLGWRQDWLNLFWLCGEIEGRLGAGAAHLVEVPG